jgi:uncharacterized protein (UPF0548 family)
LSERRSFYAALGIERNQEQSDERFTLYPADGKNDRDRDEDDRRTGMLLLQKPSVDRLRGFLTAQAKFDLTYRAVGATAAVPPAGYVVDRTRIKLGEGARTFAAAKAALERWEHFRLGWMEAWSPETPIQTGQIVAVIARFFGLWWLNACRIVYSVDEEGPVNRFGFAYGTLPEHAESGEERFTVEWHEQGDAVWYGILAFSRPQQLLARLGYPFARRLQKRFARDSAAAMRRAVVEAQSKNRSPA